MRLDYDEKSKHVSIDGSKCMLISKNENAAVTISKTFVDTKDFNSTFKNFYISTYVKGFRNKIRQSLQALKFIWK
jgi:hypothetical protein